MSRRPRVLGAVLALAVAGTLAAAPAQALEPGFCSAPYTDTLLRHVHHVDGTTSVRPVLYPEWASAGLPTPLQAPTDYVRYPWWPDVHAVQYFGPDASEWYWDHLDHESWSRAGQPTVRLAHWIDGTNVVQYASSPEVFFGMPTDAGPGYHRATFAEWVLAGLPAPERFPTTGFYRYPWSAHIGYLDETTTGSGDNLDLETWEWVGRPTPQTVTHVIGEVVWKKPGSSVLYLDSPITGDGFRLTYDQWTALGRPAPATR
ncbi:hypothetical protein C8046_17215 [Serinibacter arcticus]|uniref:Secreted protein n=1 Tax=Serinibacter arcticus TaxID=1655435 RepID=A0A2U1ZYX5_9MICO|nr:hypothetical protein [Serinibacter arcticus]PWD52122.1 hypothetical protein C8046_17215 [Serinibacter arcticus]